MQPSTKHPAQVTPRELRIKAGVLPRELATRLGIALDDLRDLEATPIDLWEIRTLREYLDALELEIHVQALGRDGIWSLA